MSHPDIVQSALGDESVAARVDLGDDALIVTPTRTLVYRADSLLSDESIAEFPHGAERISVSSGRRKATLSLDYGLDGERSFSVPVKLIDRALHPVLAGTLNATGVTEPGETVKETFRFSELTLVITSDRLVKHIGNAVWDEEFEEFHYDDVTDLAFEDGSVATTVVLTHDGRQERFKAPSERAREVRERLTDAVLSHHGEDSLASLRERFAVDEEEKPSATMSFGEGPTPLSANPGELREKPKNATRVDEPDGSEKTTAADTAEKQQAEQAAETAQSEPEEWDSLEPADATEGPAVDQPPVATDGTDGEADDDSEVESTGVDRIGTETLLGGVDEQPATPTPTPTAGEEEGTADIATLSRQVEALRETVEAQNERIARQEELLERLIAELRKRV